MDRSIKLLTIVFAAGALSACAVSYREGPPAPVVRVAPKADAPAQTAESKPVARPAPAQKTAKPVEQGTKVYAYNDPAQVPDPPPQAAPATSGESAAQPTNTTQATDNQRSTPTEQPAEQQVAKADTKQQLPATAQPPAQPKPPPPPVASKLPESTFAAPTLPAAAETLTSQAERQRQAGDHAGAAASLERSLRIAPREPYLWNRLARVRMEQGQSVQAGNLAARSNDLAGQNPDVNKDNWRIIAEAKRRAGDVAGASEAEQRAGTD